MEDIEISPDTDMAEALPDSKLDTAPVDRLVSYVEDKFHKAENAKSADEARALKAWYNFRGKYDPSYSFTDSEKSRVFVKVTKTKVMAAYGQLIEVMFGNNDFPITVEHTKLPDGVVEDISFDPAAPPTPPKPVSPFGTRTGPALPPGFTEFDAMKLGPLTDKLEPVKDRLVPGPGTTPTAVTFHPAEVAAKKMEKTIKDQLDESGASKQLRSSAFEMALFGTGILKGPFAIDKEYPRWSSEGQYDPLIKTVPSTSHVSFWNFYPDPDATNMDECEFTVERHKLSATQLKLLKKRPYFRPSAVERAIDRGPNYHYKTWENVVSETNHSDVERWEALEFWGFIPKDVLEEYDVPIPREMRSLEQFNVNVWVCNNQILRLVLNPFKPTRIPYHAVPYELNPYSFFGIGVAENMDDTQTLMNGFMRMAVDNAVLSGNLIFEVHEEYLTDGQDLTVYPGKVFKRSSGAPGQAIFATEYPNVSNQNMMMFDKARQLADESTGFPSFAHGQTGVTGVGRTASGISMLMNAANGSIRTVVKNLDDYLLGPIAKAFFAFNMQFNFDPEIQGDLEVSARGTESLMATEVRSQRLMQFLQIAGGNPMLAPFVKLDVIVRDIAKSLDLDPDKVTNSLPDAAVQAELLKQFSAPQGGPEGQGGPMDMSSGPGSGGGMMGTGGAPTPGEEGFSANTGEGDEAAAPPAGQ